jgi:crotonobetainyl-CoA:carnitine CoA-transferase CaiB-like acyl-CoA transferase
MSTSEDSKLGVTGNVSPNAEPAGSSAGGGLTRRGALTGMTTGTLAAALAGTAMSSEPLAAQPVSSANRGWMAGVRVLELSDTLAGRLAGQLLADQGGEVFLARGSAATQFDDKYFDRGKTILPPGSLSDTSSADVIIVDGDRPVSRLPHQVVMRVYAALPGDELYGSLPADCSEDLLNALVGFFTDMSITGPILGRPVIYTPLPLCSIYAGVNGAIAVVAALVDRTRTGLGREVQASRLAGGLSAIGALTVTNEGLPPQFAGVQVGGLPLGMTPELFREVTTKARTDAKWQLWLEQRFAPLAAPYVCKDGQMILPMAGPNRRLTRRMLEAFDLYDKALANGMVDVDAFDAANVPYARNNLADTLAMRFDLNQKLADWLTPLFASRTADENEAFLIANGVASSRINSWDDWRRDRAARDSAIIADVVGDTGTQIGRMNWGASPAPYPRLAVARRGDRLPPRTAPVPKATGRAPAQFPLTGYELFDLTNVVAGPSAGRMFAELGMTVVQSLTPVPNHGPTVVVNWTGEMGVGKRTIIINTRTEEGAEVMAKLAARADLVMANKMDPQMARLRIDRPSLRAANRKAIGVQITAYRGEIVGPRHNDTGYDPVIQGTVGIMHRFGPPGAPTYHGIASCVDYLCGYLGVLSGVMALYARETRGDGQGDWAETSLAAAGTLCQMLLQRAPEPASARGGNATGMNAGARTYQLSDGWIFAQAPVDVSAELAGKTRDAALAYLKARNVPAVPVNTCNELAALHRTKPTVTVNFEKRTTDGWSNECFRPTWFTFDGVPTPRPRGPARIGSDAPAVLRELGYTQAQIDQMIAKGAIGRTEWAAA